MTVVGFTGHQNITYLAKRAIARAIAGELAAQADASMAGVSSLAAGSDQIFAFCVLAAGGRLTFIQPSEGYRDTFRGTDLLRYDSLLPLVSTVEVLSFDEPSENAYYAAGQCVADMCDLLLAVWDGKAAGGLGGTADIVAEARAKGKAVTVIWPDGAAREQPPTPLPRSCRSREIC